MSIPRVLTGDRPTGPLHIGHYFGSLKNRIAMQTDHEQYILIADVQALASNTQSPEMLAKNIIEVALDYLAVGIDPAQSTIFVQSMIPEIAELTVFFMNFVTLSQLQRNPTIKEEMKSKGYGDAVPVGFLVHPISQAADILFLKAKYVPVGHDQLPLIEQARDIARAFNRTYGDVFVEPEAVIPEHGARIVGIDGQAKMSKSLGNAVFLKDQPDEILKKVMQMYTDPDHVRVADPGKVEGNVVFSYLDLFDPNQAEVAELKAHYQRGGLGDVVLKKRLNEHMQAFLKPIRERREELAQDIPYIKEIIKNGTERARVQARELMFHVREAMKINYL